MELAHFASDERDAARSERLTNTMMTNGAARIRGFAVSLRCARNPKRFFAFVLVFLGLVIFW